MIKRELYMSRIRPFIGTDLVKVMTGIRRCGKSVMLDLIKEELKESGHESPEEPPRCEFHVSGLSAGGEKPDTKQRQKNAEYGPFIRCCPCSHADIDCDKYDGQILDHRRRSGIRPFDGAEVRVLAERQTRNGKQNDLYKPFFVFSKFFQIQAVLRKRKKQQYDPR